MLRTTLLLVSLSLCLAACTTPSPSSELTDDERAAVRDIGQRYTQAWIDADTVGVLTVFWNDGVLIPHMGNPQAAGSDAIRAHFFPSGAPASRITDFVLSSQEVRGSGDYAFDRGTYRLSFEYGGVVTGTEGNYLAVARRGDDGSWRWAAYSWNHPAP